MDIRNLKTFIKVAELNNFTKAAQALGYSQSAVTVQMQQLETELGLPLFDRIGKNIKLNQYGLNFVSYAIGVIEAMEKAESFAVESKNMRGFIRFGIVDSILNSVFIPILPEFNRRFPNISVGITVGSARAIELKIRASGSPATTSSRSPGRASACLASAATRACLPAKSSTPARLLPRANMRGGSATC